MTNTLKYLLGLGAILGTAALFFLFIRSGYQEAVNCMLSETSWDYGDIHWTTDESQVVVFTYGYTADGYIPETYVIPVDGSGDVQTYSEVNVERMTERFDLALGPRRGWNKEQTRYVGGQRVNGTRQLFVTGADGDNPVQLTESDYDLGKAHWSPDGEHIAYAADRTQAAPTGESEPVWGVMVMDADGENENLLTVVSNEPDISWTPNGEHVLYSSAGSTYKIGMEGNESSHVVDGRYPTWSPSGDQMVYLSSDPCNPDLLRADGDGTNSDVIHSFSHSGE